MDETIIPIYVVCEEMLIELEEFAGHCIIRKTPDAP